MKRVTIYKHLTENWGAHLYLFPCYVSKLKQWSCTDYRISPWLHATKVAWFSKVKFRFLCNSTKLFPFPSSRKISFQQKPLLHFNSIMFHWVSEPQNGSIFHRLWNQLAISLDLLMRHAPPSSDRISKSSRKKGKTSPFLHGNPWKGPSLPTDQSVSVTQLFADFRLNYISILS